MDLGQLTKIDFQLSAHRGVFGSPEVRFSAEFTESDSTNAREDGWDGLPALVIEGTVGIEYVDEWEFDYGFDLPYTRCDYVDADNQIHVVKQTDLPEIILAKLEDALDRQLPDVLQEYDDLWHKFDDESRADW